MKARAAREALRFAAAERFERGDDVGEIAREMSVTRKSVNEWKRAWRVLRGRAFGVEGARRGHAAACRRSRAVAASAPGPHLVPAWPNTEGPGVGKGSGRVNLAGMIVVRPACRTRLIYRAIAYHGRKNEKKGLRERDLAAMLDAAYQQLGRANTVLVWDNDTSHRDAAMKKLIAQRD